MTHKTIKIGANCARHQQKYEGTTQMDYVEFSQRTARKVAISRCDQEICELFGIYTISHLSNFPTELPELYMNAQEFDQYLLENSENPYELASIWQKIKADAQSWVSLESMLHEYLAPFPKTDFERWGDKNCLSDVAKGWFKMDGSNLDVQVEEMNTNPQIGLQIDIEDCIDFVRRFRPNAYKNPKQLQKELIESRFKSVTGFNLKDYYAEHLVRSCEFVHLEVVNIPF